jgi:indolepyruvate ferredoxin oxidoreductase
MAYKDEYEVARLLTAPAFREQIQSQFEGDWHMSFHLAPPWLGSLGAGHDVRGQPRPRKHAFGPWWQVLLRLLPLGKRLRGHWYDPLGWTADRREDRALLAQYTDLVGQLCQGLTASRLEWACRVAAVPERIKGYGPVRRAKVQEAQAEWARLLTQGELAARAASKGVQPAEAETGC